MARLPLVERERERLGSEELPLQRGPRSQQPVLDQTNPWRVANVMAARRFSTSSLPRMLAT